MRFRLQDYKTREDILGGSAGIDNAFIILLAYMKPLIRLEVGEGTKATVTKSAKPNVTSKVEEYWVIRES
jgi:hypothetical protein